MTGVASGAGNERDRGFMKAIVGPAKTNRFLGCTVFGRRGGEIMSMLWQMDDGEASLTAAIKEAIFAHPDARQFR